MKHFFTLIILFCAFSIVTSGKTKVTIINCNKKSETSFAIITDNITFEKCRTELIRYKQVLEEEGLGTYIMFANWESPEDVKTQILKLYRKKPILEGVVFIGDIPIVLVREAQFMTTAFKMNEKNPMFDSSVPSDRFYDDFDLKFDFIKRDSIRNDIFYYRLSEKGTQILRSDIYSARMKVPTVMIGDKYEIMRNYLKKVVKAHREQNVLDNIIFFTGHGYNSECLTLWRQEPLVFREHFPYAFNKASHNKFLNFRQQNKIKVNLANELQRKNVDFFMFSTHGEYDTQYLNTIGEADSFKTNYERLKRSIASTFRKHYKGTNNEESFQEVLDSIYKLPKGCINDSLLTHYEILDSIEFADANMYLEDIMAIQCNPKIIILNACFNGSFNNDDGYVAGCYVFGNGKCVVSQGNTVNVLQDKWEDKLMGYLSLGIRIGMWQKEFPYLESHLIGDPTFRFVSHNDEEKKECTKLHHNLIFNLNKPEVWKTYLKSQNPLLRAAGITHLTDLNGDWSEIALNLFETDKSWSVRLTSLNALAKYMNDNTEKAIITAMNDPYEAVVRTACEIAKASGNSIYIKYLRSVQKNKSEMNRVFYIASSAEKILTPGNYDEDIKIFSNKKLPNSKRINAMRTFRNDRVPKASDSLLTIACNNAELEEIRNMATEVLGWYNLSIQREEIASQLSSVMKKEKKMPETVKKEFVKSIKRLRWK